MSEFSIKDYLDEKFKNLHETIEDLKDNQASMGQTLVRLTHTVEIHEKRSTNLEEETKPLRDEFTQRKIIAAYRQRKRREFKAKMKVPGMIFAALLGTSAFSGFVAYFWDWIKGFFS